MNLRFMIVIYTCFAWQLYYIMNLQFKIVIYTCFAWQFYYIMNLQFMIMIYTCFAWQSYFIMNLQKKAGGFKQTFAENRKAIETRPVCKRV